MKTVNDVLKDVDDDKYLTLNTTVALDSFGCNVVPKLQNHLSFSERNKNLSEEDVWSRIKDRKISSETVRKVLFKD